MILSSAKKVTQYIHGQPVKHILLTECGYFGLRMVIWLFLLFFVYAYVYPWQGDKQKTKPEKLVFYQLQWTRIPHKAVGQWNTCSLFLRLYIYKDSKKKWTKHPRNNAHSVRESIFFTQMCFSCNNKCSKYFRNRLSLNLLLSPYFHLVRQ